METHTRRISRLFIALLPISFVVVIEQRPICKVTTYGGPLVAREDLMSISIRDSVKVKHLGR